MSTEEIPRAQWSGFFDSFSRQHEGWLASLELLEGTTGPQHGPLSFAGISLNSNDGDAESIVISLAASPLEHVTHMIDHPKRVTLQRTEDGANASIEIEANDETRTLLRFRSPMRPELVDGIV
jgi:uncharacterized protein DUF5335